METVYLVLTGFVVAVVVDELLRVVSPFRENGFLLFYIFIIQINNKNMNFLIILSDLI